MTISYIRCNGTIITYADREISNGILLCVSDAMAENCEECGDDICRTGVLDENHVRCSSCEATYPLSLHQ